MHLLVAALSLLREILRRNVGRKTWQFRREPGCSSGCSWSNTLYNFRVPEPQVRKQLLIHFFP